MILSSNVSAATGSWSSEWGYDVNGASKIGAISSMGDSAYYFQFQVWGAGSDILSHSTKQIGPHQSYSTTHYSAALQKKQGRISASSYVTFTPIFNH